MNLTAKPFATPIYGILFLGFILPAFQQARNSASPVRYEEVVDQAFQFSRGLPSELAEADYRVVLRILPSSGLESQLAIYDRKARGAEKRATRVIHYKLKQGSPSISEAYRKALQKNAVSTADEVLSGISVDQRDERVTDAKTLVLDRLFTLSIPTKLSPSECMDGTTYELWVQTPSNQIHASLSDCAYGERTGSTPLFQWINAMHAEFDGAD